MIIKNANEGICPIYRNKIWQQKERKKAKINKRKTWYSNNNKFESVFFVDATPKMKLAKECQSIFKSTGLKIKVVEKSGKSLKQYLVKSNPFERRKCMEACDICNTHPYINCKSRDTVYIITCEGCPKGEGVTNNDYAGESSRSIGERFREHMEDITEKLMVSHVYPHFAEKHNKIPQQLSLKIIRKYPGNAMLRQAAEAVYIRDNKPLLNSKSEFGNMNVARFKSRTKH